MKRDRIHVAAFEGGTAQVFRKFEADAVIYSCWTLTNDGSPVGQVFEYEIEFDGPDSVTELVGLTPHLFTLDIVHFVRDSWQPPIDDVERSRVIAAIFADAYELVAQL